MAEISALGYNVFILEKTDNNNQDWYQVRIGPLSKEESIKIKNELLENVNRDVWIDKIIIK